MSVETVYCRNCGEGIKKDVEVCPECGFENVEYEPNPDETRNEASDTSGSSAAETRTGDQLGSDTNDRSPASSPTDRPSGSPAANAGEDEHEPVETTRAGQHPVTPDIADVAEEIEGRIEPDSSIARQLCRALSDESTEESNVQSALEEAIEKLETATAVTETVESATDRTSIEEYETIRRTLQQQGGDFSAAVGSLVEQLIRTNRELEEQKSRYDELLSDVEAVCDRAARSDELSFQNTDVEGQVSELAAALRSEDVIVTRPSTRVEAAAETVDRRVRPSSRLSQDLIDGLRARDSESELEETIRESVETLDEYVEAREVLSEIEAEDVRRRLDSLDRELGTRDTPVYSHLGDRVRELEALLDDPEAYDDIQLYAIYQEVSYYDRTLLPRLSRSLSGGGSADAEEMLATVRRRVDEVKSEFVSVRPDHNHSIPKHFLGLAEELSAAAEQELSARPERAAGVLLAAGAVLDHVEDLYERNEYSVMLRRLRG
jgi:hypothetical protein